MKTYLKRSLLLVCSLALFSGCEPEDICGGDDFQEDPATTHNGGPAGEERDSPDPAEDGQDMTEPDDDEGSERLPDDGEEEAGPEVGDLITLPIISVDIPEEFLVDGALLADSPFDLSVTYNDVGTIGNDGEILCSVVFERVETRIENEQIIVVALGEITECGPEVTGVGQYEEVTVETSVDGLAAGEYTLATENDGQRTKLADLEVIAE